MAAGLTSTSSKTKPKILIHKRYELQERLGSGSFGEVYAGFDRHSGYSVAIKMEPLKAKGKMLEHEYRVYQLVGDRSQNIPTIYWSGVEGEFRIMVMERLGLDLDTLKLEQPKQRFSINTTAQIAVQILQSLEHLHSHHYLHRDLKPENMLLGEGRLHRKVCLVDLGLAKRYKNDRGAHIREGTNKMIGTPRYCSINSHDELELSRRDDLESLGYILIYYARGKLPWQSAELGDTKDRWERYDRIGELKRSLSEEEICDSLPKQFTAYLRYVRALKFREKPNYTALIRLFSELITDEGSFDWS